MNENHTLVGIGIGLAALGVALIDNALTNRRVRRAAMTSERTASEITKAVRSCIVPVNRGGRTVNALAMTTPALANQFQQLSR